MICNLPLLSALMMWEAKRVHLALTWKMERQPPYSEAAATATRFQLIQLTCMWDSWLFYSQDSLGSVGIAIELDELDEDITPLM